MSVTETQVSGAELFIGGLIKNRRFYPELTFREVPGTGGGLGREQEEKERD
jgi:hypothetical protein